MQRTIVILWSHQSPCPRIIHPDTPSYTSRLELCNMPMLEGRMHAAGNQEHRLCSHMPNKQSTRQHSTRLADTHVVVLLSRCGTALKAKNIFYKYLQSLFLHLSAPVFLSNPVANMISLILNFILIN